MKQKLSWDEASIKSRHYRMIKRMENDKPFKCPICRERKKLELSNRDHEYKEDPSDWRYLCHKCHYHYDVENGNFKFYEKFNSLFSS